MLLLQDYFKIVIPCSQQKYSFWQESFWRLSKQREKDASLWFWSCFWFSHTLFCHASPDIFYSKDKNFRFCFWQRKMLHYVFGHAFGLVILYFAMLLLTYSTPRTRILDSTTHSPRFGQKVKFTIHLTLFTVTIHCHYSPVTIHSEFFAYLRGVVPYIWSKFLVCLVQDFFPRESYPLWAFLWGISLLTTTSLHLYYLYKACN